MKKLKSQQCTVHLYQWQELNPARMHEFLLLMAQSLERDRKIVEKY